MMPSPIQETIYNQYIDELLKGNSQKCRSIILALVKSNTNLLDIFEHLFRKSLYQIGDLWAKGQISVAEEHIATAITENLITQVQSQLIPLETTQRKALISCITSDLHQIGAKMVANLFELHGWESFYLGANMPATDLLMAIDRIQPDVVCLSFTLMDQLKALEVTIKEIQISFPQMPIIVGGGAVAELNQNALTDLFHNVQMLHSVIQLEQLILNFDSNH